MAIIYLSRQLLGGLKLPTLHRNCLAAISNGPFSAMVYVAFQHARFTRDPCHHGKPWALTSRFHPYPACAGRLFSVALSVSSAFHGRTPAYRGVHCPLLSGLSSQLERWAIAGPGRAKILISLWFVVMDCSWWLVATGLRFVKKYFGSAITKTGMELVDKWFYFFL